MSDKKTQLSGFIADTLPKGLFVFGAISLLACVGLYFRDHHQFMFSYLVAFSFYLSLSVGALFFVVIQHLSRAGWSVAIRRVPEHLMRNMWLLALFFIPILFGMHDLYHWTHAADVAKDPLLQVKQPYLNFNFFLIRAVFYFAVWIWMGHVFYKRSIAQDKTGDHSHTLKLQKYSTFGILLFALTVTFASIDWLMSLTPHWYSTMFGIYFFAGCAVVGFATISLIYLILHFAGFLKNIVTVEHFHDLGKFTYGLMVFWSYVVFSQYFLIWYANIPEETEFYLHHFNEGWAGVAVLLAIGHFAVPFVLFMSRHARRNLPFHLLMVAWLIFMHFVDLYWLVMPNVNHHGVHISLADILTFTGLGGIYFGVFLTRLKKENLYPVKDPRLDESLHLEVV